MIAIDEVERNTGLMNPIALMETTAAARSGVLGALATDPVTPRRTAGMPAPRPLLRSRRAGSNPARGVMAFADQRPL